MDDTTAVELTREGLERLEAATRNFSDGYTYARTELEAAIETVLREWEHCPSQIGCGLIGAIRTALNDPHGALAAHDADIRAEHTDDLVDHLRKYPNVRIAANGSYVNDAHHDSSGE